MSVQTTCPDPKRLEGLLQGSLTPPEQSALTEHVGECTTCQQALDQLAAGPSSAVLEKVERDKPASDSAYWSAVAQLDNEITQPVSVAPPAAQHSP